MMRCSKVCRLEAYVQDSLPMPMMCVAQTMLSPRLDGEVRSQSAPRNTLSMRRRSFASTMCSLAS
eukprot:15461044-Alexandrium_andersonii.AAC.1